MRKAYNGLVKQFCHLGTAFKCDKRTDQSACTLYYLIILICIIELSKVGSQDFIW